MVETSRLLLEPLSAGHADAVYSIYSEPSVRAFLITCPASRADFDRIFRDALEFGRTHGMWAVVYKPTRAVIGRVGFLAFGESARPELAFLLSEPFWGRGLATEASSACVRYVFDRRGWREVVAVLRPANHAAIRVVTKLGMSAEQTVALGGVPAVIYRVGRDACTVLPGFSQSPSVRPMVDSDASAVASLLGELGYPTTEGQLRLRLREGEERSVTGPFVAEFAGEVVGCMSLAFTPYFPDGSTLCRVTALVVASTHRGRGIGAKLIARAVDEGRRRGCSALEVTTADRRDDAHRFYRRIGFSRTSSRFTRAL